MDKLLTAQDVAKILKISKVQVYKLAQNGVLPSYRLMSHGNPKKCSVRFRLDEIEAWIRSCKTEQATNNRLDD